LITEDGGVILSSSLSHKLIGHIDELTHACPFLSITAATPTTQQHQEDEEPVMATLFDKDAFRLKLPDRPKGLVLMG